MARFRYVGHPPAPKLVARYGPLLKISLPTEGGHLVSLLPPNGSCFEEYKDIGYVIEDRKSLKALRCDPRFEEIQE